MSIFALLKKIIRCECIDVSCHHVSPVTAEDVIPTFSKKSTTRGLSKSPIRVLCISCQRETTGEDKNDLPLKLLRGPRPAASTGRLLGPIIQTTPFDECFFVNPDLLQCLSHSHFQDRP